jgi:antitoxin component YwqK of YwqJK toxin-antitoxin module
MKNIALKRAVGNTHIQPHGLVETYYIQTKTIEYTKTYKNGKLNGLFEEYHINGKLLTRYHHKKGILDGLHETWLENGKGGWRMNYKDGVLDGLFEKWYEQTLKMINIMVY